MIANPHLPTRTDTAIWGDNVAADKGGRGHEQLRCGWRGTFFCFWKQLKIFFFFELCFFKHDRGSGRLWFGRSFGGRRLSALLAPLRFRCGFFLLCRTTSHHVLPLLA